MYPRGDFKLYDPMSLPDNLFQLNTNLKQEINRNPDENRMPRVIDQY